MGISVCACVRVCVCVCVCACVCVYLGKETGDQIDTTFGIRVRQLFGAGVPHNFVHPKGIDSLYCPWFSVGSYI